VTDELLAVTLVFSMAEMSDVLKDEWMVEKMAVNTVDSKAVKMDCGLVETMAA